MHLNKNLIQFYLIVTGTYADNTDLDNLKCVKCSDTLDNCSTCKMDGTL